MKCVLLNPYNDETIDLQMMNGISFHILIHLPILGIENRPCDKFNLHKHLLSWSRFGGGWHVNAMILEKVDHFYGISLI